MASQDACVTNVLPKTNGKPTISCQVFHVHIMSAHVRYTSFGDTHPDVYVCLSRRGDSDTCTRQTKTVSDTADPTFQQTFTLSGSGCDTPIRVQVWDEDFVHDDYVGEFEIFPSNMTSGDSYAKSYSIIGNDDKQYGYVELGIIVASIGVAPFPQQLCATVKGDEEFDLMLSFNGLQAPTSSYVIIKVDGEDVYRSDTSTERSIIANECLNVIGGDVSCSTLIRVEVWNDISFWPDELYTYSEFQVASKSSPTLEVNGQALGIVVDLAIALFPRFHGNYGTTLESQLPLLPSQTWAFPNENAAPSDRHPERFPERQILERFAADPLGDRGLIGVAFSGGGSRAYAAAMGQMRALHELGLLSRTDYISSVSGGSWASTVLTYTDTPLAELLGPGVPPKDITLAALRSPFPQGHMGNGVSSNSGPSSFYQDLMPYSIAKLLSLQGVSAQADASLKGWILSSPSRAWLDTIGTTILAKFGLYAEDTISSTFTWNSTTEAATRARAAGDGNGDQLSPQLQFRRVRNDGNTSTPYLIINSCIIGTRKPQPVVFADKYVPFEYTPLYVGTPIRVRVQGTGSEHVDVGGAYVEPVMMGTRSLIEVGQPSTAVPSLRLPQRAFDLVDATGTSSTAYAGILGKPLKFVGQFVPVGLPEEHVLVGSTTPSVLQFGDGGILENLGLLALLRRRVHTAVVFVNTGTDINDDNACQCVA